MNYFANKRRKEANNGKPVVTNTLKEISFFVDNDHYVYRYETNSNSGWTTIHKGTDIIYSTRFPNQSTDEGRKVEQLLRDNKKI